eukprot:8222234-Ditylum_brightwellii.AAC.1
MEHPASYAHIFVRSIRELKDRLAAEAGGGGEGVAKSGDKEDKDMEKELESELEDDDNSKGAMLIYATTLKTTGNMTESRAR